MQHGVTFSLIVLALLIAPSVAGASLPEVIEPIGEGAGWTLVRVEGGGYWANFSLAILSEGTTVFGWELRSAVQKGSGVGMGNGGGTAAVVATGASPVDPAVRAASPVPITNMLSARLGNTADPYYVLFWAAGHVDRMDWQIAAVPGATTTVVASGGPEDTIFEDGRSTTKGWHAHAAAGGSQVFTGQSARYEMTIEDEFFGLAGMARGMNLTRPDGTTAPCLYCGPHFGDRWHAGTYAMTWGGTSGTIGGQHAVFGGVDVALPEL